MRTVGIRELKNRLSEYLRAVRAGEHVLVTDRGRVIAELRPPSPYPHAREPSPAIAAMVREGTVHLGVPNAGDAYPALPRRARDGTALRLLDELRGRK